MSEIAEYSTRIQIPSVAQRVNRESNLIDKDPRIEILKRALEIVIEEHGGYLTQNIVGGVGVKSLFLINDFKFRQFF